MKFASTLIGISVLVSVVEAASVAIDVLIYETENSNNAWSPAQRLVNQINQLQNNVKASVFGQGKKFDGFGSKFAAVLPVLMDMQSSSANGGDSLVVISDSRDVLINNPFDGLSSKQAVDDFVTAYDELTMFYPSAIVVSAEAQCCVSALTHITLGGYFNADGSRKQQACSSGAEGCLWAGDDKAEPWENFMRELQMRRTSGIDEVDDAFLNAGLIVGTVQNLIRVIKAVNIGVDEDDQAVFTDYMYHNPSDIVLDYHQRVFGNNRGGLAGLDNGGCVFEKQAGSDRLVHSKTSSSPLFLHSPGKFFSCHDRMATELNLPVVGQNEREQFLRSATTSRKLQCNYGRVIGGVAVGCEPVATPVATPVSSLFNRDPVPVATPVATPVSSFFNLDPVLVAPVPTPVSLLFDRPTTTSALVPVAVPSIFSSLASPTVPVAAPVSFSSFLADRETVPVATTVEAPVSAPVSLTSLLASRTDVVDTPVAVPITVPVAAPTSFSSLFDRTSAEVPVTAPTDSSLSSLLASRGI